MKWLWKLFADDSGPTAVEYAVLLALILLVAILSIASFGSGTGGIWGGNASSLNEQAFGS
jgi:Flp pilus assembly pilin Flp